MMMDLIRRSPTPAAIGAPRRKHGAFLLSFFSYLEWGGHIYCLDAGNCFNPHPLAKMARSKGIPPEKILENLLVSRAATCHQIVSVVEEMIFPLTETPEGKVVLILAIDSLFVDEDIPLFERQYLFERILDGIVRISESTGCLITYSRDADREVSARPWREALARRFRMELDGLSSIRRKAVRSD